MAADFVFVAVGASPNTEFYDPGRLDPQRRVVVDECLRVKGAEGHFAVGDCAATPDAKYGADPRKGGLPAQEGRQREAGSTAGRCARRRPQSQCGERVCLTVSSPSGAPAAFSAMQHGQLVAKNIAALARGRKPAPRKPVPALQVLSLGRADGKCLLPFGECCGCCAVSLKSKARCPPRPCTRGTPTRPSPACM